MANTNDAAPVFPNIEILSDERVTPFIGYCPYCPLHEGTRAYVRLEEVTREARRCPSCGRVFIVADPSKSEASRAPEE